MSAIQYSKPFIEKYINDNLYGGIGLSEYEFELINTETFQRLRRIKQQGLTSYTFPCAVHTRFCHSLGVLHIMGKMAARVLEEENDTVHSREYKVLRLAALLHDIGHYPLSHLTESVYKMRRPGPLEIIPEFDKIPPLTSFLEGNDQDDSAHHEQLGREIIKKRSDIYNILKRIKIDPEEIGEIITGTTPNKVYHQLMHSSLDADRLDYLIRDSSAAGVPYGQVDLDYLIRLISIGEDRIDFGGKKAINDCIGVNIKGIHVLEHYLMARYFSYSQITRHRTTSVFETLAKAIIYHLSEVGEIYKNYNEILEIVETEQFLRFDDIYLMNAIQRSESIEDNEVYKLYRKTLLCRNRIKVPIEIKIVQDKGSTLPNYKEEYYRVKSYVQNFIEDIAKIGNLDIHNIGYFEQKLDVAKCEREMRDDKPDNYYEAPRVIKEGKCKLLAHTDSSLIKNLFDKELRIFRLFYIDPYPKEKDTSDQLARELANYIHIESEKTIKL